MFTIRNISQTLLIAIIIYCTTNILGCASFVNIPPDNKDTAINAVNIPPVPGVMADALAFATTQYPVNQPAAVILPAPAGERTFRIVSKKINNNISAWQGNQDTRPAYRILAVRVRGSAAIVDILLPQQLNLPDNKNLMEINLQGRVTGWRVVGVKRLIPTPNQLQNAAPPAIPTIENTQTTTPPEPTTENQSPPTAKPQEPIINNTKQQTTSVTEISDNNIDNDNNNKINNNQNNTTTPDKNETNKPLKPIQPAPKKNP